MRAISVIFFVFAVAWTDIALSHEGNTELVEELIVYGRSEEVIGTANSASEGTVAYDDIRLPPMLRVGELAEAVPGMVATQHSGTGKANQYFLRGFNLDHGTDFSAFVDGVPINMRTHGHGQGYLDLNFIIPELVERTTYRKGPYSAATGDFSSAGSVQFDLYESLDESFFNVTAGLDDYYRALAGATGAPVAAQHRIGGKFGGGLGRLHEPGPPGGAGYHRYSGDPGARAVGRPTALGVLRRT